MADVANCMNASTPTKTHMGQIIPDSPDSVVLSPGVKEAMDRIFPRSATQLLQGGLSFGDDPLFSVPSHRGNKETTLTRNPAVSASCADISTLHNKSPHITTLATSDTAMAASLGFMPSATRNGSAFVNSSPALTTGSHLVSPADLSFDSNKDCVESVSNSPELQKNAQSKIRITKADFEIVTSCDALISEYERTSRRVNYVDVSSSECHSRDESDSEDMRRPFATIAREKKRRKRKKKQIDCNADKTNSCLSEHNVNSGDEFKASKSWKTNDKCVSIRDSDNGKIVSQPDFVSRANTVIQNAHQELQSCAALLKKNTLGFSENTKDNSSHSISGSGSAKDSLYKDCGMTTEDISNISYSSSKENVHRQERTCRQKLPKTKRQHYHIVKHINKIRNTFPPCFVVVEKTNNLNFSNAANCFSMTENILPLSVRVKNLSDLCNKGSILCKKNKKITAEELVYKNIFTETPYLGISDDDFEKPRVRNLRKRDKNISYAEPSEDDILVEFSRKQSRGKNNDCQFGKSGDESSSDSKKRKKQELSKKNSGTVAHFGGNNDPVAGIDQNRTDREKDKRSIGIDGQREIIVYPHTNLSNAHPYYSRTEGSGMIPMNVAEKPQHMLYSQDPGQNISMMPAPPHISILSNSSMPGAFPHHPTPVSLFPSLPPSFQGLPPQPYIGGTPTSCQVSTSAGAQGPHQFYVVKMNGKDVILRFVPSAGIGTPVPMVLPKGKTLYAPPAHMMSQPVGQPHPSPICTQAMLRPVTSVAPAAHSNAVSTSSLQAMYGIPMLNMSGHTSSHNISMPVLPVVPPAHLGYGGATGMRPISLTSGTIVSHGSAAPLPVPVPAHLAAAVPSHLTGHVSTTGIRPISLTSGIYASHSSAASLPVPAPAQLAAAPSHLASHVSTTGIRPISLTASATCHSSVTGLSGHMFPSKTSGTAAAIKSVSSSILPTQTSPALASMTSPNTTTIVRSVHAPGSNLQEASSNQSSTVRIFVPGCSSMGTPGRFATLGSLVNNSPLTRLSANSSLLPQCKRSSDHDLSPEQRAAKRRKLEKKYPLPPGVVIKTEPLDSPPKPSPTITSRSLLSSNLQLLSSSRPGSGVQRFRIISPSLATALSLRNVRGSSDIVYRTASVGGGQTVLVPTSLGLLSTTTASSSPSLTISSSSTSSPSTSPCAVAYAAKTNAISSTNLNSLCTDITSLSTETLSPSSREVSGSPKLLSSQLQPEPQETYPTNTSTIYPETISDLQLFHAPQSVNMSSEPAVSMNGSASSSFTTASTEHLTPSNISTSSWSNDDTQLPPSTAPPVAACPDNARANIEELKKMIQVQESRGLKGDRLDKLKELLHRKEQYYSNLQRLADLRAPSTTDFDDSHTFFYNHTNRETVDNVCDNGASETNPFVID